MNSANNLKESGNFHYKNSNYVKAMEYYMKSLEINPNESAVYYNLSMSQFQLQKYEDSLKNATHAINLDSKYKKAYYRRLLCHVKLGNYLEALIDSKRYLELEDPVELQYSEVKR
jgi:tetratricopeptide (TPR) repeat protein